MESHQSLIHRFHESWDHVAFVDTSSDTTLYYRDVWTLAKGLADGWRRDGCAPGDTVMLTAADGPTHLVVHLACAIARVSVCPLPTRTPDTLVARAREWTKPRVVIADGIDCMPAAAQQPPTTADIEAGGAHIHGIFFSSGTTGEAKGICLSRDGIFGAAHLFAQEAGFDADTRLLHILPMGYMAGLVNTLLATFMAGGCVIHAGAFSPFYVARMWSDIARHRVNVLSVFPSIASIMNKIRSKSDVDTAGRPSVLAVHSTSAPIPRSVRHGFFHNFGYHLRNCYGITELGGPLSLQRSVDDTNSVDAGIPFVGVDIRLGTATSTGNAEAGRLCMKSPFPMLGYLEAPVGEGNLRCIEDADGFIDTGDLASMTNQTLTVHGRADTVINKGGIKVAPFRVEQELRRLEGVDDAMVFGVADEVSGQRIVACVATHESRQDELHRRILSSSRIRQALGNLAIDRVMFYREFPKSHIGKTLRRQIRDAANA